MKEKIMIKNKTDIINILIIIFLLTLGFIYSYGNITSVYSDIGREFYIPWQMNEGQILYKDIFNVYFPFGYQINALILKFFSNKIGIFYFIGYCLTILSLIAIYIITKLYTNRICAMITTIFTIVTCVLYQSISNYIVPYSYSLLYAMCGFLWSFLMLLFYLRNEKFKYFALSCFFMGISFASKYEYCLFFFVLITILIYKKVSRKECLIAILSFLTIPIISLLTLLIQGANLTDIIIALKYMAKLSATGSVKYFYNYAGFIPSFSSIIRASYYFVEIMIFSSIFFIVSYAIFKIFKKLNLKKQIIIISFILLLLSHVLIEAFNTNLSMHFAYMGYFAFIMVIFCIIKRKFLFFILSISAFLTSIKVIGSISLELYGTFFLPLLFISLIKLIYSTREKREIYLSFLFVMCSFIYMYLIADIKQIEKYKENKINTINGETINTNNKYFTDRYNEILLYIKKKTTPEDTVLVIPEGVILNYIAQRKSNNLYYYLIPPNVELFSQETIISDLEKIPPKYIIVFNNKYNWYNTSSFRSTYGNKVQQFINNNYSVEEEVSSKYDKIYTLKNKAK